MQLEDKNDDSFSDDFNTVFGRDPGNSESIALVGTIIIVSIFTGIVIGLFLALIYINS